MEVAKTAKPLSDEDVDSIVRAMHQKVRATDQRTLLLQWLSGRSLTCQQAGILLNAVKVGMQRLSAFELVQKRISDFEEGSAQFSEVLASPESSHQESTTLTQAFSLMGSLGLLDDAKRPNFDERVARLRLHAISSNPSPIIYEDLSAMFEALDIAPLPAQKPMPAIGGTQRESPSTYANQAAGSRHITWPAGGAIAVPPPQPWPSNVRPPFESQLSLNLVPADMLLLALEDQFKHGSLPGQLQEALSDREYGSEERGYESEESV